MSIDPRRGRAYQYDPSLDEQYPYDSLPTEIPTDEPVPPPRSAPRSEYDNPERGRTTTVVDPSIPYDAAKYGDIGPLHGTPEADAWLKENVTDKGWVVDWGDRSIIAEDGSIMGYVPLHFPRMT